MRVAFVSALLVLAACEREPAPAQAPPAAAPEAGTPAPFVSTASQVEGWETGSEAYALLGTVAPDFSLQKIGGGEVTRESLRGRWTILGFWNATVAGIEEESRFIRALNSAADQDPDLDLLTVYLKLDAADADIAKWFANNGGSPWPTLVDKGETAGLFRIDKTPAYLLVGPDLAIEAYRGALSATPEDGIKPVIRGVAEIKKQIAAPQ